MHNPPFPSLRAKAYHICISVPCNIKPFLHIQAFAKELAAPFDMFVNDAFGTAHRAHGSTQGVTNFLSPSVSGFLLNKELDYLQV